MEILIMCLRQASRAAPNQGVADTRSRSASLRSPWPGLGSRQSTGVKIVLIDDHDIFRIGIRQILATAPEWRVIGEARTARQAFALIAAERPGVAVVDLALPGMDGVVATREIRRRSPRTRILILTVHDQVPDVLDAFAAGATGYALKTEPAEALLEAVASVARGERYLTPSIVLPAAVNGGAPPDALSALSSREREIFRLAAECLAARDIALELCISRKTVDTHLYRIHNKLGLRTATELVRLAARLGRIHGSRRRGRRLRTSD
jgi:DNA-binding NarL/FixJ family response regulator